MTQGEPIREFPGIFQQEPEKKNLIFSVAEMQERRKPRAAWSKGYQQLGGNTVRAACRERSLLRPPSPLSSL
jgi:hypothetical protein